MLLWRLAWLLLRADRSLMQYGLWSNFKGHPAGLNWLQPRRSARRFLWTLPILLMRWSTCSNRCGPMRPAGCRWCSGQVVIVTRASGRKWAEVVAKHADVAIVTDDNPRTEDPGLIRAAIMAPCPDGAEIGDRAQAIQYAGDQPGCQVMCWLLRARAMRPARPSARRSFRFGPGGCAGQCVREGRQWLSSALDD